MNVLRRRSAQAVVAADAVAVACLLPVLPLWLDEWLQLVGTRPDATLAQVLAYVPRNPGAVPLGYIVQHWVLLFSGVSNWTARIPAALFGVAACAAVAVLAGRLGVRRPWLAAAVFAVLPLVLRYSTEARPYSQALLLSVLSAIVFLHMAERMTAGRTFVYLGILLAAVYTQPFVLFTAIAASVWAVVTRRWRLAAWSGGTAAVAAAIIVPWILYSKAAWNTTMAASDFHFTWSLRTPLMLVREISGGGYAASIALLLLALLALFSRVLTSENRLLLALLIAVPAAGALIADAVFGYFIAVRQLLWLLPPLAVLAASAADSRFTIALVAVLAVASTVKNVRYFAEAREDWTAAVHAIRGELAGGGACFAPAPADVAEVYEFIDPALKTVACRSSHLSPKIVAAITPHTTPEQAARLLATAASAGYLRSHEIAAGGTRIIVLVRRG